MTRYSILSQHWSCFVRICVDRNRLQRVFSGFEQWGRSSTGNVWCAFRNSAYNVFIYTPVVSPVSRGYIYLPHLTASGRRPTVILHRAASPFGEGYGYLPWVGCRYGSIIIKTNVSQPCVTYSRHNVREGWLPPIGGEEYDFELRSVAERTFRESLPEAAEYFCREVFIPAVRGNPI